MSAKILPFTGISRLDSDPQAVIDGAAKANLTEVVIVGYDQNEQMYFASSVADVAACNWHLDRAKWALMQKCDELESGE